MTAELPLWPDTCQEVAARIDELIMRLSAPHRGTLSRRQQLGRTLAVDDLHRARQTLTAAASPSASTSDQGRLDEVGERLEQGEYVDPDDIEWPEP